MSSAPAVMVADLCCSPNIIKVSLSEGDRDSRNELLLLYRFPFPKIPASALAGILVVVIQVDRVNIRVFNAGEFCALIWSGSPLKRRAPPRNPSGIHAAPATIPVQPLPESSVIPLDSFLLNE